MTDLKQKYYEILGVDIDASHSEIKRQYRKLLLESHPDKQREEPGCHNTERFLEIEEAWQVLSNPQKRTEYDAFLKDLEAGQVGPCDLILATDDMFFDEENQTYTFDCRCGGEYAITVQQLEEGFNVVPCTSCTFQAHISEIRCQR